MKSSKEYYNQIANNYHAQSNARIDYLNAIDDLIVQQFESVEIGNYLDIGAGDGRRGIKISKALNINNTVLLDESSNMLKGIQKFQMKIINDSVFNIGDTTKYDLITCLWNVIGHFESRSQRFQFFSKIDQLLNRHGVLIFDVNNRYNVINYGFDNVMNTISKERNKKSDVGWYDIGNGNQKTKVYVHSPFDIDDYLVNTNLRVENTWYINYETGKMERTFFEGQLCYKVVKDV